MTVQDLMNLYGLPEKIVREYQDELIVNTPGTDLFIKAFKEWDTKTLLSWSFQGGSQDAPAYFSATAFNPPAAYAVTQKAKQSWMLERTHSSDLAHYEINFTGVIDRRIGQFGFQFYPVKVYDEPWQYGLRYRAYQGHMDVWTARTSFYGLAALIAQYENGLGIDYNYSRVKAALAYVNVANKFSQEIQYSRELMAQKAQAEIKRINFDLGDRLRRESADLSQKKFALLVAIDNDEKSKIRDWQNMLLTVQSIRLK